jgi:ribonuclease BN (tRNA processing enzyme)
LTVTSNASAHRIDRIDNDLAALTHRISVAEGKWLIWGPPGTGKTTLASTLARHLASAGVHCLGIAADPGSPGFGVPGAIALGRWAQSDWHVERLAPLCTLDAVRYRLPLVLALRRLAVQASSHPLLVDAPGAVRGPAAAELLAAILEALDTDRIIAILPESASLTDPALAILNALTARVVITTPSPLAHRRSKKQRARARTDQWDRWLGARVEETLDLAQFRTADGSGRGTIDWQGRQLALVNGRGEACAMGEGIALEGGNLRVRMRRLEGAAQDCSRVLVRDAKRGPEGLLGTAKETGIVGKSTALPPDLTAPEGQNADPACFVHLGIASALLVNGLFGDPLLHIRLRQRRRSLLFDLGDSGRLPAKIAHQVSDIFLSHAHMDHIGGFLWFLRSRIKAPGLCRLYGPPGLASHIASFIGGVRWDRIGKSGPVFEIHELRGERVFLSRIQVGRKLQYLGPRWLIAGILMDEPGFRVRAAVLDHGIPVLAFVFEADPVPHVRKDRLSALAWPSGSWIGDLKRLLSARETGAKIRLPNGTMALASALAAELLEYEPARRLVYATDLGDTSVNRTRLCALARGADALICEAGFTEADVEHAKRTGHLTARACAEIAVEAQVKRLVPFHFSRRYESDPDVIYAEVKAAIGSARIEIRPGGFGTWRQPLR